MSATCSLSDIRARTIACNRCPELRAYCRAVGLAKKREFADAKYWAKPVPSIGHADARLLIVGLAPAAHGGNRTGRMFTGDSSGAWLARALYRAGFSTTPHSRDRGDGFAPVDAFITAALRCAPPKNKPTREQLRRCAPFLREEIAVLRRLEVVVGLGRIGFDRGLAALRDAGYRRPAAGARFAHGATYRLEPPAGKQPLWLLASYHPSRQNTNTGKLTKAMLDGVFARARRLLNRGSGASAPTR